jgi:hypothetical protein
LLTEHRRHAAQGATITADGIGVEDGDGGGGKKGVCNVVVFGIAGGIGRGAGPAMLLGVAGVGRQPHWLAAAAVHGAARAGEGGVRKRVDRVPCATWMIAGACGSGDGR